MPFIANIQLLLDVDSYAEACDATSEMLRGHLKSFDDKSVVIDWRHLNSDNPIEVEKIPSDFTEDSNWPKSKVAFKREENMYCIIYGNPGDGFRTIGPFQSVEDADKYIETDPTLNDSDSWVMELDAPAA